jgi:hypothetical protein
MKLFRSIVFATLIVLILLPASHAVAAWDGNQTPGDFSGTILVGTGESTTQHGEWWCDNLVVFGEVRVTAYPNITDYTDPNDNTHKGALVIHANNIFIGSNGKIVATGKGYGKGNGGSGKSGGSFGAGGSSTFGAPGANGIDGTAGDPGYPGYGPYGGNGGLSGGPGGTKGTANSVGNGIGGGGGTAGGNASSIGLNGNYHTNSSIAFAENSSLFMGSGGGGGAGGGGGGGGAGGGAGWIDDWSGVAPGGRGGAGGYGKNGGNGGKGGGYVKLFAKYELKLYGEILTKGNSGTVASNSRYNGGNGINGAEGDSEWGESPGGPGGPGGNVPGNPSGAHGSNGGNGASEAGQTDELGGGGGGGGGAGGLGADGGAGAGGGVLLYCQSIGGYTFDPSASIDARGGAATGSGGNSQSGVIKVFYADATQPSTSGIVQGWTTSFFQVNPWDFPYEPKFPTPETWATDVPVNVTLQWTGGADPAAEQPTYDVYLDTNTNPVTKINAMPIASESYNVTGLNKGTTYYWKVVATNSAGSATSDTWGFSTIPPTGTINVVTHKTIDVAGTTAPISAGFEVTDGTSAVIYSDETDAAGDWSEPSALLEIYTITFDPKLGYDTPDPQTLTINNDGDIITFVATYELNDFSSPEAFILHNPGPLVNSNTFTINWDAAVDPAPGASGIREYVLHISGRSDIHVGSSITDIALDLNDGDYDAYVTAYDYVDNATDSNTVSFTVNGRVPAIFINISGVQGEFTEDRLDPPIAVAAESIIDMLATDGNDILSTSITLTDSQDSVVGAPEVSTLSLDGTLIEGETYTVTAIATDTLGSTNTVTLKILIVSGVKIVNGVPYNYPNPFVPENGTTIKYYLSANAKTKIMVYNSAGKPVWHTICFAGTEGGKQDLNEVYWDGKDVYKNKSTFGNYVANGPYLYFIIVDGKVIGRGEMAAYK